MRGRHRPALSARRVQRRRYARPGSQSVRPLPLGAIEPPPVRGPRSSGRARGGRLIRPAPARRPAPCPRVSEAIARGHWRRRLSDRAKRRYAKRAPDRCWRARQPERLVWLAPELLGPGRCDRQCAREFVPSGPDRSHGRELHPRSR